VRQLFDLTISQLPPTGTDPAYLRIVPEMAVVLAATALIFNLARDIYALKEDKGGLVPVQKFIIGGRHADQARTLIPHFAGLMLIGYTAIAVLVLGNFFRLNLELFLMGVPIPFFGEPTIFSLVTLYNLLFIVMTAWLARRICRVRHTGLISLS
jgi:hypothetical protein